MITANASTTADDLGVAASGDAAIEGALVNNARAVAAPRVFLLPEFLVVRRSSPTMISLALSSTTTHQIIFHATTCAQSLKSLPLMPFILMCPPQMVQRFQISKFMRDHRSTGILPHQVPQAQEGISFHPFTCVSIARNRAWEFVRPIGPALQETLHHERLAVGLLLKDDNPLNHNN
jgi:hypothetical protein